MHMFALAQAALEAGPESVVKRRLTVIQQLYSFHGFLSEAVAETPSALFMAGEKLEQVLCAQKKAVAPPDTSELGEAQVTEMKTWCERTVSPVLSVLEEQAKGLCDKVEAVCNERLQAKAATLKPLARGLDGGKSWKASLAEDAPLVAVYATSKQLLKGPAAARITSAYKELKKDCSGNHTRAVSSRLHLGLQPVEASNM